MKIWKYILTLATVALTMSSCLYGIGQDEEVVIEGRLTLNASTTVIYANGEDEVIFTPKYGSKSLSENDITLYDGSTHEEISLPGLRFSTETVGTYLFYATYLDGEELKQSEMVTISAIDEQKIDVTPTDEEGLNIRLTNTVFQSGIGSSVFVIRYNGEVLNANQVTIYDAETSTPVKLGTVEEQGYTLPEFRSDVAGNYRFYAEYKVYQSDPVAITVVDFAIPPRMEDPEPENLDFKRRIMLIDHTGVGCQYCPYMLAALEDLSRDEAYNDRYVLTATHTFGGDPYAPVNATGLAGAMGVTSWPTVIFDMATYITNVGYESNLSNLKSEIDKRLSQESAKAGISATMAAGEGILLVRMTIKAAESGIFRVGAWLMEDGIYAAQMNHGMPEEGYDFDTHNHVVRYLDSSSNFLGHALNDEQVIPQGATADYLFQIPIMEGWKAENCNVCLFVTTPNSSGHYKVNNVVVSKSLTESITFDYAE